MENVPMIARTKLHWKMQLLLLMFSFCCTCIKLSEGIMRLSSPEKLIRSAREKMPELFQEATETIQKYGYPLEIHKVISEDGYVLTLHRIPWGRDKENVKYPRIPVLMHHGIFGSSDSWVIGGPGISPAFTMADNGYDVWIANARGSFYSREHLNMTDKNPDFWRFSWDEIGRYDLPAEYDYVLKFTGHNQLIYFGHSLGNNIFYVMMSLKPEYNAKTMFHLALAPAVFWDRVCSSAARTIRNNHDLIKNLMGKQNTYELLRPSAARNAFYYFGCRKDSTVRKLCIDLYSAVVGNASEQDPVKIPMFLARMMGSTSGLVMIHLAQNAKSGKFSQFDYGSKLNMQRYGRVQPPEYDLKKATVPTVIYTSTGDDLVPAAGVARLSRELSNVVEFKTIQDKSFTHVDFILNQDLDNLILRHVLNIMTKYSNS